MPLLVCLDPIVPPPGFGFWCCHAFVRRRDSAAKRSRDARRSERWRNTKVSATTRDGDEIEASAGSILDRSNVEQGVAVMVDPSPVPSAPPHSVFATKVINKLSLALLLAPSAEERFAEAFFDCDPDASSSIGRAACHERKTSTDNIKLVASTAVQGDDSPVSLINGDACRHERVSDFISYEAFAASMNSKCFSLRLRDMRRAVGRKECVHDERLWVLRLPADQPIWTCRLSLMFFWEVDRRLRGKFRDVRVPCFPVSDVSLFQDPWVLSDLYIVLASWVDLGATDVLSSLWKLCRCPHCRLFASSTPPAVPDIPPRIPEPSHPEPSARILSLARELTSWAKRHAQDLSTLHSPQLVLEWRASKRQRDVFPLPHCSSDLVASVSGQSDATLAVLTDLTNVVCRGLSLLTGYDMDCIASSCSVAQESILRRCAARTHRMLMRFQKLDNLPDADEALDVIIGTVDGRGSAAVPLVAASYDIHRKSGQVDVLRYLESDIRKMVTDPSLLFPGAHAGLRRFVGVSSGQSSEYAKLTMMELTAGKTELADDILGGGTVFGRAKDGGRIRVLLHGSAVSEASAPPPKPPHLASPACLLDLEAAAGRPYYMSKRDGRVMFD